MLVDGLPSASLIAATGIELLICGLCLLATQYRNLPDTVTDKARTVSA